MAGLEIGCAKWFSSRFRGSFSLADLVARPAAWLMYTEREVPFSERSGWFRPIGLDWESELYRSTGVPGWALTERQWPIERRRFILKFAARRSDVAYEPSEVENKGDWSLAYRFDDHQSALMARYAVRALLFLYSERLARLRDGARIRHRPRRPVGDALALDDYLTGEGLDAIAVASDVRVLTDDISVFKWNVLEYVQDQSGYPDSVKSPKPREFVSVLHSALKGQAERLLADLDNTTGNMRASAELRQAVANTRLQRTVLIVSLAALIVAVAGIIIASLLWLQHFPAVRICERLGAITRILTQISIALCRNSTRRF
jgi:hypothetical protein